MHSLLALEASEAFLYMNLCHTFVHEEGGFVLQVIDDGLIVGMEELHTLYFIVSLLGDHLQEQRAQVARRQVAPLFLH